jgi:hypothetical protein
MEKVDVLSVGGLVGVEILVEELGFEESKFAMR